MIMQIVSYQFYGQLWGKNTYLFKHVFCTMITTNYFHWFSCFSHEINKKKQMAVHLRSHLKLYRSVKCIFMPSNKLFSCSEWFISLESISSKVSLQIKLDQLFSPIVKLWKSRYDGHLCKNRKSCSLIFWS